MNQLFSDNFQNPPLIWILACACHTHYVLNPCSYNCPLHCVSRRRHLVSNWTIPQACIGRLSMAAIQRKREVGNRELKQATYLSTRTPTRSKSSRYRWRMMAVFVWNQERKSSFLTTVLDLKRELLMQSLAIYNVSTDFRLASVNVTSKLRNQAGSL